MKVILYKFLLRKRLKRIKAELDFLRKHRTREEIEKVQVSRFNAVWKKAYEAVPFYSEWRVKYGLPEEISTLAELNSWPILTKEDLRKSVLFERTDVPKPKGQIMTGGSTGTPVRLPTWHDDVSGVNQIIGRRKYGVRVGDKVFLLWGHEHLYGIGLKRRINIFKRRFKDWLADWKRVSAYDLSAAAMHSAYDSFEKFKPKFVIGFSPAVLSFVRHNIDRKRRVDSVRVILCTAGPLTCDEKIEIEDFFGGVVCMEYGSVECGVMAYTRPSDGNYNVFWNTHLLQAQRQSNGEYKNLVTGLTDCYVPLIRYDIGDYLDIDPASEEDNSCSVLEIRSVKGRPSEMINFSCGVSFFGALIGDCVKQVPDVISSQIAVDENANRLEIRVTSDRRLDVAQLELIKNRFELTVAGADKLELAVVQREKLYTTIGGKTPRVTRLK